MLSRVSVGKCIAFCEREVGRSTFMETFMCKFD